MKVEFGNGTLDVVMDLQTGELWPYTSPETAKVFHHRFGGSLQYSSTTSLTGNGYVADLPQLAKTDILWVHRKMVTLERKGQLGIAVPAHYHERRTATNE